MNKLNQVKFGLAGGLVTALFVLLVDIFLWVKLVPLYNQMMVSFYGVTGYSSVYLLSALALFILIGFILGFLLTWFFAFIYNKLLLVKMK